MDEQIQRIARDVRTIKLLNQAPVIAAALLLAIPVLIISIFTFLSVLALVFRLLFVP